MGHYVYMLASRRNGTLYVGTTNDLVRRAYKHREGAADGFTRRHKVKTLVYFEALTTSNCDSTRDDVEAMATGLEGPIDRA